MPIYSVTVSATSNTAANTDDTFMELLAASGSALRIRRVELYPEGAAAAGSSVQCKWKLVRLSVAGATGTSGTVVKKESAMRATAATATVKNGATAFSVGTITDTVKLGAFNTFSYDPTVFLAKERADEITIAAAVMFGVIIQCTAVSTVFRLTVEFED